MIYIYIVPINCSSVKWGKRQIHDYVRNDITNNYIFVIMKNWVGRCNLRNAIYKLHK